MPSQATVHIVGHLGQDPTLRHTQKGDAVLGFSVATNRPGAKRDDNEPATWWNCSLWGKRAEMFSTDLRKGDLVILNGNLSAGEVAGWRTAGHSAAAAKVGAA